ncbi:class A beta-lactamase [Vibrio lentus]|uniref:Beta-lactamase n=1 Tax=Vibrio lentus TaxID=136468 RepID=A0AA45A7C5_9VIBR|nr:class A beta-lactamase [Vibrio lentus]MCB5361333.1 class A beta-lactamase [Vibrio lentus]MCB5451414.1 class A beta-lactamase [Vibrio lentus]MCB5463068.1 class A beta-lactamase [Vibrio lentus]MCC4793955.1 class A beta-lactamase [Vibrio lentus]MCC4849475.1 class A beta-lactamase [Vibrio lentus]
MKKYTSLVLVLLSVFFSTSSLSHSLEPKSIEKIESRVSARIGIAVYDSATKQTWSYKGDERFPMMSTFKTLACANLLYNFENEGLNLGLKVGIESDDLIVWSPVTKHLVGKELSLENACTATMTMSDNTAANVVLTGVGGPNGLTEFLRLAGDSNTRLDHMEPELNHARPGDVRDTTTPNSMVVTLNELVYGNTLSQESKLKLKNWMMGNKVSDGMLRSILPNDWSIADRSGAGSYGSRAITAMVWSENRAPLIISISLTETELTIQERDTVINEIGQLVFDAYLVQ